MIKSRAVVLEDYAIQKEIQYHADRTDRLSSMIAFFLSVFATAGLIYLVVATRRAGNSPIVACPLLYILFAIAVISLIIANHILSKNDTASITPSWFARWAGIIAVLNISACIAAVLIYIAKKTTHIDPTPRTTDSLSTVSYIILAVVALLIIGGLGWCFYRAITASAKDTPIQYASDNTE